MNDKKTIDLLKRALKQINLSLPDYWTDEEEKLIEDLEELIKTLESS